MTRYALLVELEVFSEISIGPPLIGPALPALPAPPPTTLLGALSYPYLREQTIPEVVYVNNKMCSPAVKLIDKVHYVSAGFYGRIEQRALERVIQTFYLRKEHLKDVMKLWSVAQRGLTVYADNKLYLFYVISDPELAKYAYGITRVGRKESIVVVRSVVLKPLKELVTNELDGLTIFYTPKECAERCEGSFEVKMSTIHEDNLCKTLTPKVVEKYYIAGFDGMRCKASDNGLFLRLPVDEVEDVTLREYPMILVPKKAIGD
jgi:CRISPR-associated protein Cas5a/b/c